MSSLPCARPRPPVSLRPSAPGLLFLALSTLLFTPSAHASFLLAGCDPSDSTLLCRLRSVLTGLETLAWILGILLVLAILLAVRAYRRKPRKITPDDITPDAR